MSVRPIFKIQEMYYDGKAISSNRNLNYKFQKHNDGILVQRFDHQQSIEKQNTARRVFSFRPHFN